MIHSRAVWLFALLGCFVLGAVQVWKQSALRLPPFRDVDASLRDIAVQHLGSGRALDELRAVVESLPKDRAVIVVGPGLEWGSTEIYLLTSYVGWPRPVWFVAVGPDGKPAPHLGAFPPPGTPISAMAFFDVKPPIESGGGIHRIGTRLVFVPEELAP
jgi:hypothetical protein